jgi:hypothetical protein
MDEDSPGWGHPHRHDFKPIAKVGGVTMTRCSCGAPGRPVIEVEPEREEQQ